jgi:hypothetical protein
VLIDGAGSASSAAAAAAANERAWLQSQFSDLQVSSRQAATTAAQSIASLNASIEQSAVELQQVSNELLVSGLLLLGDGLTYVHIGKPRQDAGLTHAHFN